jgi:hypothetical protein
VQFDGALVNAVPMTISVVPVFDLVVFTQAVMSAALELLFTAKSCRLNVVPVR